jgi:hypothetical protein
LLFLAGRVSLAAVNPSPLDVGYRQMYDLDFAGAHITFESWKHAHPEDPLGPVSNAAAFLFSEFERLHILETELFTDNSRFLNREKPVPDPVAKNAFEAEIARTRNLADLVLAHSPQDQNAQFADILADGLRGDYIALIEQRNFAGLSFMKAGRSRAEKLLSQDPAYYDCIPGDWCGKLPCGREFGAGSMALAARWSQNRQGRRYQRPAHYGHQRALSRAIRAHVAGRGRPQGQRQQRREKSLGGFGAGIPAEYPLQERTRAHPVSESFSEPWCLRIARPVRGVHLQQFPDRLCHLPAEQKCWDSSCPIAHKEAPAEF